MVSPLAELLVSIVGDVSDVRSAFDEVGQSASALGQSMTGIGTSMQNTGKSMSMYVTAPLLAMGAGAFKVAMDFDDSMRQVQAVTGTTGESLTQLTDAALQMGADTAFSSSQAADAMLQLGQAGFTVDEILTSTDEVLSLASAGALDLGTAAQVTANALAGFGFEADQTQRVVDVLAKGASISTTDITGLGNALSYVAPVAHAMGMSLEETTSIIAALSNAGIEGERAGTALRGAISRLAAPSNEAADALARYGLSLDDVNPATHTFTEILETLAAAGIDTAGVMEIFGQEAGPGVLALLSQGTGAIREQTTALEQSTGAAQQMAATMEGGVGGAWRQFTGSVETLAIKLGDLIATGLQPAIASLTSLFNTVSSLPGPVLAAVVGIAALAAAIGPVLIVAGTLISSIGTITTAIAGAGGLTAVLTTVVGILTGPVAIAIAAFAAAAYIVYKNWDTVGPLVKETFDIILAAIKPVADSIMAFVTGALASLSAWWATNGPAISQAATTIFNVIGPVFTTLSTVILGFVYGALVVLWESFTVAVNIIIPIVQYLGAQVGDVIMLVVNAINGDWSAAWQNAQNIVQRSWDFIVSIFNGQLLYNAVKGVWDNVLLIISQTLDLIIGIITGKTGEAATGLKNGMVKAGADMITGTLGWIPGVSGVVDGIVNKLTEVPTGASQAMTAFGPAIINPIDATAIQASAHAGTLVTSTVNQIGNMPGLATGALSPLSASITSPIDSASVQAAAHAGTLVTGTVNQISFISPRSASVMSGFSPAVVNPITAAISPASAAASRVGTGATTSLNNGMSPMVSNAASTMSGVASSIRNSGSSLASAATSAGSAAVSALQTQLAKVQYTAAQIKAAAASGTLIAGSRSTGSSSGSSGSTGITRQGSDGTGESGVRIREAHATGGLAGYTGWHWMEEKELAVPEQFDWDGVLTASLSKAVQSVASSKGSTVSHSYGGDTNTITIYATMTPEYDFDKLMDDVDKRLSMNASRTRFRKGITT